uniref:Alanine--tRNA ligase n=1 Tax=Lygus hesperus TaxID=30085 RepID=A0A0A9X0W5_LYGHE
MYEQHIRLSSSTPLTNNVTSDTLMGSFGVVREHNGKLVTLNNGITAEGLRVFRGTLVQALFIDKNAALDMEKVSMNNKDSRSELCGTNKINVHEKNSKG